MTLSPVEIAVGKAILDNVRRTIVLLQRRARSVDAGGARYLEELGERAPVIGSVGHVLLEVASREQSKLIDKYFESPEFAAALRHVFAARVLFGPSFREEARKSVAIIGAGLRMYIPAPTSRMRSVLGTLSERVLDLVDDAVLDKRFKLLDYATEAPFQAFLQQQLQTLELVVDSVARAGDPREIVNWLDQYQRSAGAIFSKVRTPHWNDQVVAPMERVYVPARFRYLQELTWDDYRLAPAEREWRDTLNVYLNDKFPVDRQGFAEQRSRARKEAEAEHDHLQVSYSTVIIDRLVVLGDPGAGKTTLVHRVAHDLLSGRTAGAARELQHLVPLVVTLREFARVRQQSFAEHISDVCATRFQARPPGGMIEFLLATGRALVIFDGLDELPDTSRRAEISEAIEAFAASHRQVKILVTSHLVGYEQAPLDPNVFTPVRILPFDDGEVKKYATTWFLLDQALSADQRHATAKAFLDTTRSISDLRSNPLLLALLCNLYRATGYQELPRSRPAILEKCAMVLFDRWDRNRGIGKVRFEEDFAPTVAYLAFRMFTLPEYADGISEDQMISEATDFLVPSRFTDEAEARLFCKSLIEHCHNRAWVFTDVGTDPLGEATYQFTHRTFMEYFAAAHIVRRHKISDAIVPIIWEPVVTASWGLVPQLVLQILARSFDDDAGRAMGLLLDRMEAEPTASDAVLRFAIEVLRSIPLPAPVISRVVDAVADHATNPTTPRRSFLSFTAALNELEQIASENRAAFVRRAGEIGFAL